MKVQRWIDLLAALLVRRYPVRFEELVRDVPGYREAASQATLQRMFERDKDELRAFGIAIETVEIDEGESSGYVLRRRDFYLPYLALAGLPGRRAGGYALDTLTFEPDELMAIADAAQRACDLGDELLAEDAASALRKLAFDLPIEDAPSGSERVVPSRAGAAREVFELLSRALASRKRISCSYHTMQRDAQVEREIEPYGLFFLGGNWYLAGRDPAADGVRNFRLSRMTDVTVNGRQPQTPDYEIPEGFRLEEHARSRQPWELGSDDAVPVIVELRDDAGASRAAERLGAVVPGSERRRRFMVRRPDAFARWLLSFGGGLVPVEPAAFVTRFRRLARETLAAHERRGGS